MDYMALAQTVGTWLLAGVGGVTLFRALKNQRESIDAQKAAIDAQTAVMQNMKGSMDSMAKVSEVAMSLFDVDKLEMVVEVRAYEKAEEIAQERVGKATAELEESLESAQQTYTKTTITLSYALMVIGKLLGSEAKVLAAIRVLETMKEDDRFDKDDLDFVLRVVESESLPYVQKLEARRRRLMGFDVLPPPEDSSSS